MDLDGCIGLGVGVTIGIVWRVEYLHPFSFWRCLGLEAGTFVFGLGFRIEWRVRRGLLSARMLYWWGSPRPVLVRLFRGCGAF